MRLFQKLIKVLNKFKLKQTKSALNGKNIDLTSDNVLLTSQNFNVDSDGEVKIKGTLENPKFSVTDNINTVLIAPQRLWLKKGTKTICWLAEDNKGKGSLQMPNDGHADFYGLGTGTFIDSEGITTPQLTQTSQEKNKKNFEKLQDNALDILKTIDIYKYNLKNEKDTDKKHIGFVIGDNFNYSKEVTSLDNQGVDNYSFTSLCCKAIQELSRKVEELQKEIKELKEKEEK